MKSIHATLNHAPKSGHSRGAESKAALFISVSIDTVMIYYSCMISFFLWSDQFVRTDKYQQGVQQNFGVILCRLECHASCQLHLDRF